MCIFDSANGSSGVLDCRCLTWVLVFRVTYSIVGFTHFEIDLGGVVVVIYIEKAGLINLSFLYICISEDYLFLFFY